MTFDQWLDALLAKNGWTRATLNPADITNMREAWNAAIGAAAGACKAWGEATYAKWQADPEMATYAGARAWDSLQCAHAVSELKQPHPKDSSK
jgi:hypothetical protein